MTIFLILGALLLVYIYAVTSIVRHWLRLPEEQRRAKVPVTMARTAGASLVFVVVYLLVLFYAPGTRKTTPTRSPLVEASQSYIGDTMRVEEQEPQATFNEAPLTLEAKAARAEAEAKRKSEEAKTRFMTLPPD